jgi:hypothetical protein
MPLEPFLLSNLRFLKRLLAAKMVKNCEIKVSNFRRPSKLIGSFFFLKSRIAPYIKVKTINRLAKF